MTKQDMALIAFVSFVIIVAFWIVLTAFPYLGPFV